MIKPERVGTEIGIMTGRIKQRWSNGRENVAHAKTAVTRRTRRAVRRTDYYVHDNAWKLIGIVAGAAFVGGYLLPRRNRYLSAAEIRGEPLEVQGKVKRQNSWELIHSAIPLTLFFWKAMQASRCAKKAME